ncbi:hypothetical protein B0J13DRAFT_148416 [Dactylonectria estremocensis]|uniref:Uncharacterized protein n=1 Tax=Dactylonectria estremocensis TaxID=1079267 RepID=A0A9P9DWL7_9HYPO|nr:hypothetical protein B0J13DRAFT_148416 [Dactylonectria estremocensis]
MSWPFSGRCRPRFPLAAAWLLRFSTTMALCWRHATLFGPRWPPQTSPHLHTCGGGGGGGDDRRRSRIPLWSFDDATCDPLWAEMGSFRFRLD